MEEILERIELLHPTAQVAAIIGCFVFWAIIISVFMNGIFALINAYFEFQKYKYYNEPEQEDKD